MKELSRKWHKRILVLALCFAMILGDSLMVFAAPDEDGVDMTNTQEVTATPQENAEDADDIQNAQNTQDQSTESQDYGVATASPETDTAAVASPYTRDVDHGNLNQVMENGKKYFIYDDGTRLTGWFSWSATWRLYLDPNDNGAAVTGYQKIGDGEYVFNKDGLVNFQYGTPVIDGRKYWVTGDGTIRTGWQDLGSMRLYFDPTLKYALVGIWQVEGKYYLFNNDGVLIALAGTPVYDGKKYWFKEDGSLGTGWLTLTNWIMYFDPNTFEAAVGRKEIDGKKYLFNADGVAYTSSRTDLIDGKKYWFNEDGSLSTGWQTLANMQLYMFPDTWYAATGLTEIDGKTYYFDENGVMRTGPILVDGSLRLFLDDGTLSAGGTPIVGGKKYYVNSNGVIQTGWVNLSSAWRLYFNPDQSGAAAVGFTRIDGNTYYFNSDGLMQTGFQTIDGSQYCFRSNGVMYAGGTPEINGKKYGFASDGKQIFGWHWIGDYQVYFNPNDNGAMVTGKFTINGTEYEFDNNGILLTGASAGSPISTAGGQKTVKNLLQNALKPVGNTLYIWGGGHDTADATRFGVNPNWSAFFVTQNSSYDYTQHRFEYGHGLDCSGFVGWAVYNTINTRSGQSGVTTTSTVAANYYANTKGWGTYYTNPTSFSPGDVVSRSGHTWIVLGQCSDGSVVIVHATPPGGVQIGGTVTPSGSSNSEAVRLARTYMQKYYPSWYFTTGSSGKGYLENITVCRWNVSGSGSILTDPDRYQNMTAAQVLRDLFGE